ncbi:amino acid permease family protein [Sporothrix schenckii 1099-18]|uniref:Amino acid permease family protein n=1 Tax=Sporothrix schenckii 1099-18 TaxID=1397361 RepID=A0A0F2MAS6_SPOSC|nr:amino acid permease family protein [Sporothrix schenckii 1099-18]KJR86742.1 amino acid permease family protein [Sporothrix schenckii 1099-18]
MPVAYASLQPHTRDSLELASLASSSQVDAGSNASSADGGVASSRPSISSSRKASLEREDPLDFHNPAALGRRDSDDYDEENDDGNRPLRYGGSGSGSGARPGGHGRTFSVSSGFDLAANLFPLSSTAGGDGYAPIGAPTSAAAGSGGGLLGAGSLERHKTLTYLNGLSLIVGLIIGSGIFSSPSLVNANVGSPGAALLVWVVAGVLAWTGAASYAELGGAIPLNGGSQVYLAKILGELFGFLFTWVAVLVLKPGSAAIIALIMGEYLVRAVVGADAVDVSPWINKSVALLGVLLVTLMNSVSTKLGTRVNDLLMFLKFVALLGVTVTGIVVAATGYAYAGQPSLDWKTRAWFAGTNLDASAWAVAVYAGLWAFDGWDNTNYVVGEFRNPRRDLPRVIHTAMPLVIGCYVLANVAYFLVLSLDAINATNTVAVVFGAKVFGPVGALVFALVVSASCFGALNSSTFTSSRLVYVAGREGYLPAVFGRIGLGAGDEAGGAGGGPLGALGGGSSGGGGGSGGRLRTRIHAPHSRSWFGRLFARLVADEDTGLFFTPIYALALNCALTCIYVFVGEFGTLLTFYGVAGYTFYFLTVLGLIVLRVKEPHLERPYKVWITTPIIFCCVSLFLLSRAVFGQPLQTVIVVGFVLAGVPVYYWRVWSQRRSGSKRERGDGGDGVPWYKFWQTWRR